MCAVSQTMARDICKEKQISFLSPVSWLNKKTLKEVLRRLRTLPTWHIRLCSLTQFSLIRISKPTSRRAPPEPNRWLDENNGLCFVHLPINSLRPRHHRNKVPRWQSTGVDTSQQELLCRFGGFSFWQCAVWEIWCCTVREWWTICSKSGKSNKRGTASLCSNSCCLLLLLKQIFHLIPQVLAWYLISSQKKNKVQQGVLCEIWVWNCPNALQAVLRHPN